MTPVLPKRRNRTLGSASITHRKNAICASCHATFDPIGLALENFDAIGQYRATYPNGSIPIDASGQLADGPTFVGLAGA